MLAAFPVPEVLLIPFLTVINIGRGDTWTWSGKRQTLLHVLYAITQLIRNGRGGRMQPTRGNRMLFPLNVESKDDCPSILTGQYLWTGPSYVQVLRSSQPIPSWDPPDTLEHNSRECLSFKIQLQSPQEV